MTITFILPLLLLNAPLPQGAPASDPSAAAAPAPPASAPASRPAQSSLDDLLNIDEGADTSAEDAAERDRQARLEQGLTEKEAADAFDAAVGQMTIAADLLQKSRTAGAGTQRTQEEILRKLDSVIDAAKKNQKKNCSGSSSSSGASSSDGQKNPAGSPPKPQPGQAAQQGPDNKGQVDPPPPQEGALNTIIDESRAEWGNLPQRVRDMIEQGMQDRISSMYKRLTEDYYRRLAEEASK